MSNKKSKEIQKNHDSESEDEQESGSERDSDFDSDGNFVGDKVSFITSIHMACHVIFNLFFITILFKMYECYY